ncbi:MAG TPA: efflux RND transporter permease subunit [Stellaceae bacterium]|nr:efflux RND transporter permease subunit [Stellaceae bacterium]
MNRLNLSAWALAHRPLILFMMIAAAIVGAYAYLSLGRAEDPSFTFKVMTIRTEWPGATAREVEQQVTDRIEKKLEELQWYDYARSYSKPGESVVFLNLKDSTPASAVPDQWYQARKKIGDIVSTLPSGVQGPYFNDEFGDVYSMIYAFTGADFSPAEMKKIVEEARERVLSVPGVEKADLIGDQDQKIYVEVSSRRLASYGIPVQTLIDAIRHDNDVTPAGQVDTGSDRVYLRVDAGLDSAAAVRALPVRVNGRTLSVGDLAEVSRGYADPKAYTIQVDGKEAIGLGVVMTKGGNILALEKSLSAEIERIRETLPQGAEVSLVADQAKIVEASIGDFVESLLEALAIVMAVSFISLGWRSGIIVALAVPLVLGMTFGVMLAMGIDLHRVSSGALIIALGLLVDDAIIAVEMMVVKIAEGWDRLKAGAFAYTSTAFPMLTGTLVTAAGFVPVGFAQSNTAEYTNAIFWVVAVALMLSWIVAVLFTPYLGFHLLPAPKQGAASHAHAAHDGPAYRLLRRAIELCLRNRWWTIGAAAGAFVTALAAFGLVQQQFFPSSSRPELMVDITLPQGASFAASAAEVDKLEQILMGDPRIDHYVAYTGGGTPRFFLSLDQQLQNANFSQFVVTAKDPVQRDSLRHSLEARTDSDFPEARVRVSTLELGPPVGYPVQFRVSGGDPATLRKIGYQLRDLMRADPNTASVNLDWDELEKSVRISIDPAKAKALGIEKSDLAQALDLITAGRAFTQYREGTELIDVVARTPAAERLDLEAIGDLAMPTASGASVPLRQVATIGYELEEPILWRRSRDTTLTVRADVTGGVQAPVVSQRIDARLGELRASLPDGYKIVQGGAVEESAKGQAAINKMMPLMVLIMITTLMLQLQSLSRVLLVVLTAPLGLIGVTAALLVTGLPFGFVAMLGVIALAGIIMRNSVILVDQIDQDIAAGHAPWDAVMDATVRRARPILLTAAAAILAMIPLAQSVFWGPMAIAIMGGLAGATLLTLFVVPAMYAAWFRIKAPLAAERPAAYGDMAGAAFHAAE